MILRKPDFYDNFKCIADRCSDTCCVGWEIDVDRVSQARYQKVCGPFGDKLRASIEEGHFKLLPQDRCPFLNKTNLCEIYTHLGEGALCDICREHPRFVEVYGDIMEKGLGLCCEEAARLLLTGEGPLAFTHERCDEPEDEIDEDDREIRDQVLYERESILDTLADSAKPFGNRLYEAFGYTGEKVFYPFNSARDMLDAISRAESYGPAWDKAMDRIKARIDNARIDNAREDLRPAESAIPEAHGFQDACRSGIDFTAIEDQGFFTENESARLLAYLIYRHFAKSLYEGREQGKLLFALFFWNMARYFTRELAGAPQDADPLHVKIDAVKILSKQFEYSEENMQLLESVLDGDGIPES